MEEEEVSANQLGENNTIKHPKTGELVKVAKVEPYGQGVPHSEATGEEPIRQLNHVRVTLESGEEVPLKADDKVIRRRE